MDPFNGQNPETPADAGLIALALREALTGLLSAIDNAKSEAQEAKLLVPLDPQIERAATWATAIAQRIAEAPTLQDVHGARGLEVDFATAQPWEHGKDETWAERRMIQGDGPNVPALWVESRVEHGRRVWIWRIDGVDADRILTRFDSALEEAPTSMRAGMKRAEEAWVRLCAAKIDASLQFRRAESTLAESLVETIDGIERTSGGWTMNTDDYQSFRGLVGAWERAHEALAPREGGE